MIDAQVPPKQDAQLKKMTATYPEIVSRMFNAVVSRGGNHQDAKKILVDWYMSLSPEEKTNFKTDTETLQIAIKRCEAAVDMIRQESQMLVHRFEQGS